jgi:uncharacterized protein
MPTCSPVTPRSVRRGRGSSCSRRRSTSARGTDHCYFWATHASAELDLLVVQGNRRRGIEVKLTDAPAVTRSMRIALQDLKLDTLDVIHAGSETYPLAERIRAVAASRMLADL